MRTRLSLRTCVSYTVAKRSWELEMRAGHGMPSWERVSATVIKFLTQTFSQTSRNLGAEKTMGKSKIRVFSPTQLNSGSLPFLRRDPKSERDSVLQIKICVNRSPKKCFWETHSSFQTSVKASQRLRYSKIQSRITKSPGVVIIIMNSLRDASFLASLELRQRGLNQLSRSRSLRESQISIFRSRSHKFFTSVIRS